MQVVLISECTKSALKETRRILDQFAERRGERTWQTSITWEGLKTLRRLLRSSARKNTAVACHWIRGTGHTELLWTVGKSRHFNYMGAVPTDTTCQDMLRLYDENDWHTGEAIYLLSSLAALLHDLGKACDAFQLRLSGKPHHKGPNIYRHEWVSLRLFQAFVGTDSDKDWISRLLETGGANQDHWLRNLHKDGKVNEKSKPFMQMPPLAQAVGWLVVSHHRLPDTFPQGVGLRASDISGYFNNIDSQSNQKIHETINNKLVDPYWKFQYGLPVDNAVWQKRIRRIAKRLLLLIDQEPNQIWLDNLYVMHLSRLSLMLADHYYSSLIDKQNRVFYLENPSLYANRDKKSGKFNQSLEEHLVGVAVQTGFITHSLPRIERSLPSLANHRGLRKRSQLARFRWQDKAFDLAVSIREKALEHGAFIVNMASTGCGKTLANARIMYALAEPEKGARFSVALGLRTLTLQTGQAYRDKKMFLDNEQLAIRVGGSASRDLFNYYNKKAQDLGSESLQDLVDEDGGVLYEGDYDAHPLLVRTLHNNKIKSLISAPVLVCTVDHLVPATEGVRGGRQIAPMLRLMTSDLVLDEIDDYGLDDLPALARLVHWAGLLGSRVMLSSATLSPSLVQGLFAAYKSGREQYQNNRGNQVSKFEICCVWVDEFSCATSVAVSDIDFREQHDVFVNKRVAHLMQLVHKKQVRRISSLVSLNESKHEHDDFYALFAYRMLESAIELHDKNSNLDKHTHKNVSFGLIRMANIRPLVQVALRMFKSELPTGYRVHLCVYHSQYPLLMRSAIEHELDKTLDRSEPKAVFDLPRIRKHLTRHDELNHLFIVLGSPVTEVGRDHDYDWAVVEPSSMRSIIQLAGRIRRHRSEPWENVNVHLLARNIRSYKYPTEPSFQRPGFEQIGTRLKSHDLHELLHQDEWRLIDSRPRILERDNLSYSDSLVDIEHYQLQQKMLIQWPKTSSRRRSRQDSTQQNIPMLGAHSWWSSPHTTLMALLQNYWPFRKKAQTQIELALLPNEDEDDFVLHRIEVEAGRDQLYIPIEEQGLKRVPNDDLIGEQVGPWFTEDYIDLLVEQAEAENINIKYCAKKYGTLTLPAHEGFWWFHPVIGFYVE